MVHPSTDLIGRQDFDRWMTFEPGCFIERDCTFWIADETESHPILKIGNVFIGRNVYIGTYYPIQIKDDTLIGAYSYIISGNHRAVGCDVPVRKQGYEGGEITIGRDVWIGCHVVVLPGVDIGDHAVIGAGSVVTKSVPGGEVWAGIPAKKIRER